MKKFLVLLLCSIIAGCSNSYGDAIRTVQNLDFVCNNNSYRVTRVSDGDKEVVTVTCIRQGVK
jgi:hypothetical protein